MSSFGQESFFGFDMNDSEVAEGPYLSRVRHPVKTSWTHSGSSQPTRKEEVEVTDSGLR